MSDKSPSLFGWDLLYGNVEKDIKLNQDVLVCFVHLVLVTRGFKCIGIGDSKVLDGSETKSESLPKGWNDGYTLRYVFQGRLYNLKGSAIDNGIIINLIRVDERSISIVQLNNAMVAQRTGTLNEVIPENENLLEIVRTQLIDKVMMSKKTKDTGSQTAKEVPKYPSSDGIPSRLIEPQRPAGRIDPFMPPLGPVGVGSADLNPFGVNPLGIPQFGRPDYGTGGMLYIPPRGSGPFGPDANMGIPGGALPPGARFDPFRPPDVDRFPRPRSGNHPDNDEMPPPGFDNMFM